MSAPTMPPSKSSESSGRFAVPAPISPRRTASKEAGVQNGTQYRILNGKEMEEVKESLKLYQELFKRTKDPVQQQLLRLQYKEVVCQEMESNLGTEIKKRKTVEGDNKRLRDDLKKKEQDVSRLSSDVNKLSKDKSDLASMTQRLRDEFKVKQARFDAAELDLQKRYEEERQIAKKLLEDQAKQLDAQAKKDIESLKQKYEAALQKKEEELSTLKRRLDETQGDLQEAKNELESAGKKMKMTEQKIMQVFKGTL